MKVSLDEIVEGYELPPTVRDITLEKLRTYDSWPEVKNIHNDDEVAQRAGLPKAVCRGTMFLSYVSEMLCDVFGEYWLRGGRLSASFLVPVYHGDTVTARVKVAQKTREDSGTLFNLEVNVENQRGEKAATGTATVNVSE